MTGRNRLQWSIPHLLAAVALRVILAALVTLFLPLGQAQWGKAQRGARLVREQKCHICHRPPAATAQEAPDLTHPTLPELTPNALVATFWNHGPILWRALVTRSLTTPDLSEEDVFDIYAHFFAQRAFDPPGDAERGHDVFVAKNCFRCHALVPADGGIAPPVSLWPSVSNPVAWVENMWNHGIEMREEIERAQGSWPQFTAREMIDLLAYLENAPVFEPSTPEMQLGDPRAGRQVFADLNCAVCHKVGTTEAGKIDLLGATKRDHTPTSLAVAMWNHQPVMFPEGETELIEGKPFLDSQMNDLLAFFFARGYFGVEGDAKRGRRIFHEKSCAQCHEGGSDDAPLLPHPDRAYSVTGLGAAFWRHGPVMRRDMLEQDIDWPKLAPRDAADLRAFLDQR
jgi:hypothetical protein